MSKKSKKRTKHLRLVGKTVVTVERYVTHSPKQELFLEESTETITEHYE